MINSPFALAQINDFVAGDEDTLYFDITNENGVALDSETLSAQFSVIDYTNKFGDPLLVKKCHREPTTFNRFSVTLLPDDTIDWFGKYIYQVTSKDVSGRLKSSQGVLMVVKNIDKSGTISFHKEDWK